MKGRHPTHSSLWFKVSVAVTVFTMATTTATFAEPKTPPRIEIGADKLEVTQTKRRAVFSGNVKIKRGTMTLTCSSLEATYDEKGALNTLKASGAVQVTGRNIKATAGAAQYNQSEGTLALTNKPTLQRGRSLMRGEKIMIWIDQERVVIDKAQGTLDPTLLTPPESTQ